MLKLKTNNYETKIHSFSTNYILSFKGISQSYTVNPIPFQQYTGNLANLSTNDDMNSPLISLPFSFEFYGNSYNQVVISTNGYIDFRTTSAGGFSHGVIIKQFQM